MMAEYELALLWAEHDYWKQIEAEHYAEQEAAYYAWISRPNLPWPLIFSRWVA